MFIILHLELPFIRIFIRSSQVNRDLGLIMSVQLEISSRLGEIVRESALPDVVLLKLDGVRIAEASQFSSLAAREGDLGEFPKLVNLVSGQSVACISLGLSLTL